MIIKVDRLGRLRGFGGTVLFGAGGVALIAVATLGVADQSSSERMYTVLGGLACLVVAMFAGITLRKPAPTLTVDQKGLVVRQPPELEFSVRWSELHSLRLSRSKRQIGRSRSWFYQLDFWTTSEAATLAQPDLEVLREGEGYRFGLGHLGRRHGRKLYRACEEHAPGRVERVW
ncbi:hypothetical protein BAY61_14325 [Prauserella marina]|uniref:Uncharacterized protein n=1 Tax=Prauserella marina TaxID=530584 RepID=A0A222VQ58_9PSEU|nr:hypothetical protein [Prauserella marina]ASR35982.1 hypothetical protein BAY61_14325 [Prauserella marina]PWV84075.1 hypothetical protein DES30_10192 [Prauserella marina]SDC30990.1 hypothetical protein SAMN05421630_1011245 [Prauserella marina]